MMKRIVFCLASVLTAVGHAGDLTVPFSSDSAAVLPAKVRNVRVTTLTTTVADVFNAQGRTEGLAAQMNKTITWEDLAKAQSPGMDRHTLRGYLLARGFSLNEPVGQTHGIVNSRVTATVPVLAYGLTPKVTMAVAVPVIYSHVNVATGWTAYPSVERGLQTLSADGRHNKVLQNEPKLQNVVQTEFASKGYKPPRDAQKTQMGDVTLVTKVRMLETTKLGVTLQPRMVMPTGRRADINDVFDVAGGDGQFDVGLGVVTDYFPSGRWTLTGAAHYLNQLPTRVSLRIPTVPNETLTPDVDSRTKMNLGDSVQASLTGRYKLTDLWTLSAGASAQYKQKDDYRGASYDSYRYDYLETDTEQAMASALGSIGYSTIALFREKRFPVPFEATLTGSQVFAGRNVRKNTVGAFELAMFF
ncbi:MAG: transporter [Bdellovibrionaceae bacterium]|nr:transporter [Pseudobdellovibrionaceae bacterium]